MVLNPKALASILSPETPVHPLPEITKRKSSDTRAEQTGNQRKEREMCRGSLRDGQGARAFGLDVLKNLQLPKKVSPLESGGWGTPAKLR